MNKTQNKNSKHIDDHYTDQLKSRGISRSDFIKFCSVAVATMSMPLSFASKVAKAITDPTRPPVIWLHFQECTGCTETLLRATHPTVDNLVGCCLEK